MAEWSMAVVLKVMQGWEGHQLLPIHPDKITLISHGQLRLTNRPLRELMREAFQRWQTDEIVGGPSWIDTDRWDVVGKTESATDPVMPRLRTLLADRFKLVTHHEARELSIYALMSDGLTVNSAPR